MKFKDKIAVVTGGGSGIGEGICFELARNGAYVFVTDVNAKSAQNVAQKIKQNDGKAAAFRLDVTNANEIAEFGNKIKENYGLIDYWVNNTGISEIVSFFNHTEELWDQTMEINLKGQYLCCKLAIEQMLEKGKGSIVNISSQSGKVGTSSYQAYSSSKFGVIGLTQSLSTEFSSKGIRVNSVAPGVVYTQMWANQKKDYAKKRNLDPDEVMDYFREKIPAKRLGTVEDVAKVVNFLLSDDADYVTGQTINVNGGDIMF